jgi:hypothetical protein
VVRRSTLIWAILTLALVTGCGESKSSNPPAPAYQPPPAQPAEQASTDKQPEPSLEGFQAEPTTNEETALPESAASSAEYMPQEKETPQEKRENDAPATARNEADNRPQSRDDAEETPTKKPGRSSGKLLRGLGSSLGRALSKTAGGADSAEQTRPPPDLADDPFPDGEPVEKNKSKE